MSALDRKMLRDLWRIKGQAIAIALVIATGVLLQVMMSGLVASLSETRRTYYERNDLAEVFAPVVRAPQTVLGRLATIPGVDPVSGRVVCRALIDNPSDPVPNQSQS